MSDNQEIRIRRAGPSDRPIVRTLLPNLTGREQWSQIHLAETPTSEALGASALVRNRDSYVAQLAATQGPLHQPLADQLLEPLLEAAKRRGVSTICAPDSVSSGSPAAAMWERLGFGRGRELVLWKVPFREMATQSQEQVAKLRARGRIPASASIVELKRADPAAVAKLVSDHIGGTAAQLLKRLRLTGVPSARQRGGFDDELCLGVLLDGETIGVKLAHWHSESEVHQEFTVIDPDRRGSWAWSLLHDQWARLCLSLGATHYRCTVDVDNQNMQSLTKRYGGEVLDRTFLPILTLGATAKPAEAKALALEVRPAAGWEGVRIDELLPEAANHRRPPSRLVALRDGVIVGAAALEWLRERNRLAVRANEQDAQVVATLLDAAIRNAREKKVAVLSSWQRLVRGSTESDPWLAAGFSPYNELVHFETDAVAFLERFGPRVEQLRRSGQIPANAQILPLPEADPEAVAELHNRYLKADRAALLRAIRHEPGARPFDPRLSTVLLVGDHLAGLRLIRLTDDGRLSSDALVIEPRFRRGWAGPYFSHDTRKRIVAAGYRSNISKVDPANHSAMAMTRSHGGVELSRTFRLRIHLPGPIDPPSDSRPNWITVVCGATDDQLSEVMRSLQAIGLEPLTDVPERYNYTPAKNLLADASWLPFALGRAVAVPLMLVSALPQHFDLRLILVSQPHESANDEDARRTRAQQEAAVRDFASQRSLPLLEVSAADLGALGGAFEGFLNEQPCGKV